MSDIDFVIVSCIVNGNSDRHDTASQRLKLKLSAYSIQCYTMGFYVRQAGWSQIRILRCKVQKCRKPHYWADPCHLTPPTDRRDRS